MPMTSFSTCIFEFPMTRPMASKNATTWSMPIFVPLNGWCPGKTHLASSATTWRMPSRSCLPYASKNLLMISMFGCIMIPPFPRLHSAELFPQIFFQFDKARMLVEVRRTRTRQTNLNGFLDAGWARRQQDDAVAEAHGFGHAVRHKDHRLARALVQG